MFKFKTDHFFSFWSLIGKCCATSGNWQTFTQTTIMNMTGGYTARSMKGQTQSPQCAKQRVCLFSPNSTVMGLFASEKSNLISITSASQFYPQKTQVLIRDLEHKLRTSNMILQSDQGTNVNTFKSHLSMFDLPKWMCSLCLIALY